MMTLVEKLRRRIERQGLHLARLENDRDSEEEFIPDDDWWLSIYEEQGRNGFFKDEPDFPIALEHYRDALARARASLEPPLDPPHEFLPNNQMRRQLWRMNWPNGPHFKELSAAHDWVAEMHRRVHEGIPPVTEAGFRELAEWFAANEARLRHLSQESQDTQLLDLDDGRRISCANIRFSLREGPRASGAGQIAEDIRELKRRDGPVESRTKLPPTEQVEKKVGGERPTPERDVRSLSDAELMKIIDRGRRTITAP